MAISLSSISAAPQIRPPRICLYGPHGIGKSSFGAMAPNPIFVPTEEGFGQLNVPAFPLLKTFGEVIEALAALHNEQHDYQSVIIDSVDWLEPMIWTATAQLNGKDDIEAFGFGKGYIYALDQWRTLFGWLNALRDNKNMAVVMIAHCQVKRFDDPNTDPYDRYSIKLQERASALVQEWADMVAFANFKTYTTKTDVGFNQKKTRGTGTGERVLYTEERPSHLAKNRYSLPPEIPFVRETVWPTIHEYLTKPLNK
jgi:hypothetical protein